MFSRTSRRAARKSSVRRRRPTAEETKQAEKQAKEQKKEAEKQAKQQQKDAEKQAKEQRKEEEKQAKLDEQTTQDARGEIRRMRLYDESVTAARAASEEAQALIDAGDYSGAIGKLRAQQSALGQSVKYLPETPESVQTRANVAENVEGIGQRIPELRKQALAARQGARTTAEAEATPKPPKAGQADEERRRRSETGERLAERYRAEARSKYEAGDLLGAHAAYRASLQALNDVMKITPAAEVGRRTQLRNAITAVENDLSGVSGELKKGKPRRASAVDVNAPTAELPATPLLDEVNNPGGGVPPRTEPLSGAFGRLARQQEAEREVAPRERRKATDTLSPIEYLKRRTDREGIRVSDRGEAALLGSREAGIVGLVNRDSKWMLSDAQVLLDEGGFMLDDGRRFTDQSVTESDVLDFLNAYGKEARLDTEGLDRRLAEEEAEFYANLPSEAFEEGPDTAEAAPLSERPTEPESAEARPVEEAPPARRPTERRFVPKATDENIEELRNRREQLSRVRYDRAGEFTGDLRDEYRELGSRIAEYENEKAKADRGGRPELAPPPGGDERVFARPSREDMRRAFAAAEARLAEETDRASSALPKSDTELLERGRAAVDALFAEIESDVDALDLLDRAIEGDENAREELIEFAERSHAVDADTVDSIIDARRFSRERERGAVRQIAQARSGAGRAEAGAARHGANGETVETGPQARELSPEDLEALSQNPEEVADEDYDQYLRDLEQLNNDRIRGLVEMPEWAERQLEARLKQANEIRRARVKEKRLGAKNAPQPAAAKPLGKVEGGRRLVEQAQKKQAEKEAEEPPTVVHSNPAIDRQPILAETNRGTVIVPNHNNKTGVSEVRDRSDEPSEYKFSSTQVNLPAEVADRIIAFGRRIPDADLADDGREDEPHVTVKFGLHGSDPKFAREALAGEGPVKATFGKVSLFETNPDFDVVKVDIISPDLHRLNKKVAESQPVTDTHPTYQPHATIAYVRKGRGAKHVGNDFLEGKTITLDSVTFSGRDGERVEIPLTGKAASELSERTGLGAALDDIADRAWERIKQRNNGRLPANFDPQDMADIAIWGAAKLAKGAVDFSQWSRAMVKKFGEQVRPHLLNLWQKAKALQTTTPIEKLLAGADKLSSWRDWYSRHQSTVQALFDEDAPLFQQLLAATSQHASVAGNVTMALKAYRQLKAGEPFKGYLPAVIKNLERIRNNEALSGLKISEFGKGTTEVDVNAMAVDMHVADALFGTKRPTPKQIEQAKFIIRTLAAKMGWTPIEMQSVIWAYNQVRQGRIPTDYGEVLTRKADEIRALRAEISGREGRGVPSGGGVRQAPADRRTKDAGRDGSRGNESSGEASGGTYLGFGLGSLQPLFNRPAPPKTTPYRQIADALGHEALKIDAASIADEAIDALAAAVSRGKAGSLPFARAVYWADKLKAKKVAGYLKNRQVQFITEATNLVQEVAKQSVAMDQAKRGSLAWEKARRELDRARVKLSNHLARAGEYDHPLRYAAKGYKASLLSAPHIPFFNVLAQVAQFPFHEAQRAIDFLVPAGVFRKWGIPYDKAPVDIRTWAPAMARELGAIASGAKSSFGDVKDMLWYGVTETGLDAEAARRLKGAETEATDKYEMGGRPRLIPGLDQAIMAVGRIQGAADIPLYNVIYATALAAEADETARKIARDNPQLKLTKAQIKDLSRDLAAQPSPAMIVAAADEADRFKLDYPTWAYNALQAIRNLPVEKFAGRHADATFKSALDFAIPFSKIPLAAVDTALFRYSPAGMVRVGSRLAEARKAKAKGEEFTGRYKTAEQFGRDTAELYRQSIVGTLAWATLGLLGSMGYAAFTGGGDDDKRQGAGAVREALGERFTPEMEIGDTAVDLGKLGPVGQAASIGARVAAAGRRRYDTESQDLEDQGKRALRVLSAAKKGLLIDNPIGRALTDVTEEGGEDDFIRNKARGVVPGILRDVARMTDDTKRMADQGDLLGNIRGDIQSGIPGLRKQMEPRLDVLGRPVEESNPFSVLRSLRPDPQLEDLQRLDVGLSKPQREPGESAKDYNERVRERGEQFRRTLGEIRDDETMRDASPDARRSVYAGSLRPQAMERAGKLSDGSVRVERQIEGLRGNAYAALRSMPEYRNLNAKDQKAVRDLIGEELERFRATASSVSRGRFRREKRARVPGWTPAELAKAAVEARP